MTLATFGNVAIACSLALIAALVAATLAARRADARREDAAMPEDDWPVAEMGIGAATENREDRG